MSNNLIESTLNFVNNTSKINGNLRSGVIKEESGFSKEHIESGLKVLAHHQENGHPSPDDAVVLHGMTKYNMSQEKAVKYADGVRTESIGRTYAAGPAASGDPGLHAAWKAHLGEP